MGWREEVRYQNNKLNWAEKKLDELETDNERLRKILKWYADKENYIIGIDHCSEHRILGKVNADGGKRAREGLKK